MTRSRGGEVQRCFPGVVGNSRHAQEPARRSGPVSPYYDPFDGQFDSPFDSLFDGQQPARSTKSPGVPMLFRSMGCSMARSARLARSMARSMACLVARSMARSMAPVMAHVRVKTRTTLAVLYVDSVIRWNSARAPFDGLLAGPRDGPDA